MAEITCIVVTPETTALTEVTSFVVVPLYDGELGIASGHGPLIGRLGQGELRITKDGGQTVRYFVDGGFVQIADNVVSVLTDRAIPASEIDRQEIQLDLEAANSQAAHTDELREARDKAILGARAQLQVARGGVIGT